MNCKFAIRKPALCFLVFIALGASPALLPAEQMQVLGGTLSWTTTSVYEPCGGGGFQIMEYTSFTWQYGNTVYPVSGSTAYIYNSSTFQCPLDGPQGGVGYTLLSSVGFPPNCSLVFIPTGPPGDGTITTHNCTPTPPALPPPPSNATHYQNLECWGRPPSYPAYPNNANYIKSYWNNWVPFDGSYTGSTGSGADSMQPSQNISGTGPCGSLEVVDTNTGGGEWNVLGVLNACGDEAVNSACPSIKNMELDLQFVMPSSTNYQALEFDPDVTWEDSTGKRYTHKISVACQFHPDPSIATSPIWVYFDSAANLWKPFTDLGISNIPCNLGSGRHRVQLYATVDEANHQYTYQEMLVDNFPNSPQQPLFNQALGPIQTCDTRIPVGQPGGNCSGFHDFIGVEQQVDNNSAYTSSGSCGSSSTVCAYYDNYSLVVW